MNADEGADTNHKRGLARFEPWKIVITAFTTGAATVATFVIYENWVRPADKQPMFPPGTVITIPPAKP